MKRSLRFVQRTILHSKINCRTYTGTTLPKKAEEAVVSEESRFYLPAEWAKHRRCWMLWPNPSNWRLDAIPAQNAFLRIAWSISLFEPVKVGVASTLLEDAQNKLQVFLDIQSETDSEKSKGIDFVCWSHLCISLSIP